MNFQCNLILLSAQRFLILNVDICMYIVYMYYLYIRYVYVYNCITKIHFFLDFLFFKYGTLREERKIDMRG